MITELDAELQGGRRGGGAAPRVLPGHGRRHRAPSAEVMHEELARLVAEMKQTA